MNNSFGISFLRIFSLISTLSLGASAVFAQNVVLTSGNSVANVNLFGGTGAAGMNSWTINTQNQLQQQWFWFRVGETGQQSLDSLGAPSYTADANSLDATYTGVGFKIEIAYQLNGGQASGSNWTSDIKESISILNTSTDPNSAPLDFHFYQYSDFSLGGTVGNSSVQIYQNGTFFSKATVLKGGSQLAETIDDPLADHAEAGVTSDFPNTLQRLNGGPLTLNDNLNAGPDASADGTWALEWDRSIAAGEIQNIMKDKSLNVTPIPEPTSLALLSLGLGAFILRRSRRLV